MLIFSLRIMFQNKTNFLEFKIIYLVNALKIFIHDNAINFQYAYKNLYNIQIYKPYFKQK